MSVIQTRGKRKVSGGLNKSSFTKRLHSLGRLPSNTKVNKKTFFQFITTRGDLKKALLTIDIVNVYDPAEKKYKKLKIKTVVENSANRNFVKRNIITKGAVVETEEGRVRITSRPGQLPHVNGILIKE